MPQPVTRLCARDRAEILRLLTEMEIESRPGSRGSQGCLKASGLAVARALLFAFMNVASGRCDPSHAAIAARAGCSERSVRSALDRLEAAGVLVIGRKRYQRRRIGRRLLVLRTSNAYEWRNLAEIQAIRSGGNSYRGTTESDLYKRVRPDGLNRRIAATIELEPPRPTPAVRSRHTAPDPALLSGRSERLRTRQMGSGLSR